MVFIQSTRQPVLSRITCCVFWLCTPTCNCSIASCGWVLHEPKHFPTLCSTDAQQKKLTSRYQDNNLFHQKLFRKLILTYSRDVMHKHWKNEESLIQYNLQVMTDRKKIVFAFPCNIFYSYTTYKIWNIFWLAFFLSPYIKRYTDSYRDLDIDTDTEKDKKQILMPTNR